MAELTEQQKLEIHNKIYQAGKGMIPVQELTYAASQLCKDNSEANQVEVLRNLKQFSMPGIGTTSVTETIAAEAIRDACDRNQDIMTIMEEAGIEIPKKKNPIKGDIVINGIVTIGSCRQSSSKDTVEPIEWHVLDIDEGNNRALLFCKNSINIGQYGTSALTYGKSTIHGWMNDTFYNGSFSEEEKEYILDSTSVTTVGSDTSSVNAKLFAISREQLAQYIQGNATISINAVTPYALQRGNNYGVTDGLFWLRNKPDDSRATIVTLTEYMYVGTTTKHFYRPAMWVKID